MPRRPRIRLSGLPLHVILRGNNRGACFFADEDYHFYLHWLRLLAAKHQCAIHAYVLMTNHVHLLLTPSVPQGASQLMQALGRRYVQYINRFYRRSGTLWEGRFKASLVNADDYLFKCHRYIELNPVRAGMVRHPGEYRWSSYRCNALLNVDDTIQHHPLYKDLGSDAQSRGQAYTSLFKIQLDEDVIAEIRTATNKGRILGSDIFRREIQDAQGGRKAPGRAGRPRRGSGGFAGEQMDMGF